MNLFPLPSSLFPLAAAVLLLQGCQSYEIVQRNIFADDDGNVVVVDYGRSESEHCNTFVSPVTGETLDFHSKLMLKNAPAGIQVWHAQNAAFREIVHDLMHKMRNFWKSCMTSCTKCVN